MNEGRGRTKNVQVIKVRFGDGSPISQLVAAALIGRRRTPPPLIFADCAWGVDMGLVDRAAPATELIAKKIIELTKAGERDPARLKDLTIQAFEK